MGDVPLNEAMLFPVAVLLVPVLLATLLRRAIHSCSGAPDPGRSPFTVDLARAPGYSLQRRVESLQTGVAVGTAMALVLPLWFYSMWLTQRGIGIALPMRQEWIFYAGIGTAATLWFAARALVLALGLRRARLSLHGKMAAGQEIDQLMRSGARVFHDLPGEGFNIDHVVVAPAGVFCIETETRTKPRQGRSVEDATATFDGHGIAFPDVVVDEPVRHARERSRWLADWLTRATGFKVAVQPVVALPRWVIDRKGPGDVFVINPRESARLLARRAVIGAADIDQIAFRLERLGRGKKRPANALARRRGEALQPVANSPSRGRTQA